MSSATTGSTERKRRGRVMLVGDHRAWEGEGGVRNLSGLTGLKAFQVANLFDAMGELVRASAGQPIDAVFVSSEQLNGSTENAAHALRRIDPGVMLVCVGRRERVRGFDAVVDSPLDASVRDVIDRQPQQPAPPEEMLADAVASPVADQSARTEQEKPTEHAEDLSQISRNGSLGDTDLVHALMSEPNGVQEHALSLIRQQTGWKDLRLLPESTDGGEPVRFGEDVFGTLICGQATGEQLKPWAQWLGMWLGLDASYRDYRHMAYHDEMTGAWNRRYFDAFLDETIKVASARRRPVTVMVFDIDDFKVYNDTYGHAAGDEILRETVRLLNSVIRKEDRVCRIGGDEFAVIFADIEGPREVGSAHPENIEQIAQRFQDQVCTMKFPKLGKDALATLSISAGLATYPWDGSDAEALLEHADQLALQSKKRGKNALTLGPGARQYCRQCKP